MANPTLMAMLDITINMQTDVARISITKATQMVQCHLLETQANIQEGALKAIMATIRMIQISVVQHRD